MDIMKQKIMSGILAGIGLVSALAGCSEKAPVKENYKGIVVVDSGASDYALRDEDNDGQVDIIRPIGGGFTISAKGYEKRFGGVPMPESMRERASKVYNETNVLRYEIDKLNYDSRK